MTVALEVLWFTNLNYHEQRWQRLPPRLNCLQSQQVDRLGARTKSATNGRPASCLASSWPERNSDPKLRQHIKVFEKLHISQVELIHPSQTEWMSLISLFDKIRMEIRWDLARTSEYPPWEAPGRNRPSSVLLLNPVRLLLLLVEVVSSACSSF